jgi:SAM-dependent methyltransferase
MSYTTSWNPENYAKNARFVGSRRTALAIAEAQARRTHLRLGLWCALTEKIAGYGCKVIGVDSSFPQLRAAKQRGLTTVAMDGQGLGFKQCFDAVFTNAALHWMKQPNNVAAGCRKFSEPWWPLRRRVRRQR